MANHTLKHLTIKPFLYCGHRCQYCDSRQKLFSKSRKTRLGIKDWIRVLSQARELGVTYLDISGGEPALYPDLPELVRYAKRLDMFVSVNATGHGLTKDLVQSLSQASLDQIIISIMSLAPRLHNQLRGRADSWREMVKAIEFINAHAIRLAFHFIMSRDNFRELPDLIRKTFEWNACSLALVYPENDYENKLLLMSPEHIEEFHQSVIPHAIDVYSQYDDYTEQERQVFLGLYNDENLSSTDYTKGQYWPSLKDARQCDKPYNFTLIYSDGSVFPCNGIEYVHEPLVGNVSVNSLQDIWHGQSYQDFRHKRTSYCIH